MSYEEGNEEQIKELERLEQTGKSCLSKDALLRYGTLKSAYPEKAMNVITYLAKMIQVGKIDKKISDTELKEILKSMENQKKEINIRKI